MTEAVFADTPIERVNPVDELVGEGKKFKTIDDLAAGKLEADRVIAAREQELADLRAELAKRATTEDLVNRIQARQTPPQSERPAEEPKPAASAPSFTDEDLKARIRETTQELSREEKVQSNVKSVAAKLTEYYGDEAKANQAVTAKARELGVDVAFLQSAAADSPAAFYQLLGLGQAVSSAPSVTHSDLNAQLAAPARSGPKPGTYAYYENIRATQGAEAYFDPKVQQALMRDAFKAAEAGVDFYGS